MELLPREWASKNAASLAPSKPGIWTTAARRQIARTNIVNKILDFSSGILKQLLNVLAMDPSMVRI
jgi:hypothetical protein